MHNANNPPASPTIREATDRDIDVVWAFVRKDIGDAVVSNTSGSFGGEETVTQYRLGGYSGGVSLRVGLRFDQKRSVEPTGTEVSKI